MTESLYTTNIKRQKCLIETSEIKCKCLVDELRRISGFSSNDSTRALDLCRAKSKVTSKKKLSNGTELTKRKVCQQRGLWRRRRHELLFGQLAEDLLLRNDFFLLRFNLEILQLIYSSDFIIKCLYVDCVFTVCDVVSLRDSCM